MNLEHTFGMKLIIKAYETDSKEKCYQKWLSDVARYELPFDEYYKKCVPFRKSTEEEKEEILKKFGGV